MKKQLLTTALIAIAAGFCLSAGQPSAVECKEIAMLKCTKDTPSVDDEQQDECNTCKRRSCGSSGCNGDQSNAQSQVKSQRKSAAQKVVEGN